MSLFDILKKAKTQKESFNRQKEIEYLDLNPEDYLLLRDDQQEIGLDLLWSILERIKNPNWTVDQSSFRLSRLVENNSNADWNQSRNSSRQAFSITITSNSKRFFIRAFRDYTELSEYDLIKCQTISEAIKAVDDEIRRINIQRMEEERLRKLEQIKREQEAKEAENKRIQIEKIDYNIQKEKLSDLLIIVNEAHKKSHSDTEGQINAIKQLINGHCTNLPTQEVEVDLMLSEEQTSEYEIKDEVPCQFIFDTSGKTRVLVSSSFIEKGINYKNLISEEQSILFGFNENTHVSTILNFTEVKKLQEIIKDIVTSEIKGDNLNILFSKNEAISKQLERVVEAIQNHINQFTISKRMLSINSKVYENKSNKEIFENVSKHIDEISENAQDIIWSINNRQ